PFLVSILLVIVSIYIRMRMKESPLFTKLKSEGKISVNPLKESFTHKANLKMVLLALFGATMGQGVIWYTGQFYAQSFIENVCKIDFDQSRTIIIWAILFATPLFVVFGSWSDRVGRKWIMLVGMLAGILFYRPIYNQFLQLSFTANIEVKQRLPEPGSIKKVSSLIPGTSDSLVTTSALIVYPERLQYKQLQADTLRADGTIRHGQIQTVEKKLFGAVYWKFVFLVFIQIVFVTMVYGPIAAFLVEMFPTKIRYTSMSLPYHVGNGVFGGLTPFIATLLTTIYTGDKLVGLWYPIIIAAVSLMIGALYINNKIDPNVND
ncbi:MAG: MFS transporter, partial [Sphingobacteriales bacterium]